MHPWRATSQGWARALLQTRRQAPADLVAAGGTECGSPAEVAEKADVIITMVPDTPDVEQVLFGPGGVVEGLSPGKTSST